jgi:hypothetical protein
MHSVTTHLNWSAVAYALPAPRGGKLLALYPRRGMIFIQVFHRGG